MKMKCLLLLVLMVLPASLIVAQDAHRQWVISIESGISGVFTDVRNRDNIRGDVPIYYSETSIGSSSNLSSYTYKMFVGAKTEVFSLNEKLGFATGLRFSQLNCSLGNDHYSSTNYLYYRYRESGTNSEYLRIQSIDQNTDYLGIPFEFQFFPNGTRFVRFFIKAGAEMNFRVHTTMDVKFHDDSMEKYQKSLTDQMSKPNFFSSSVYASAGFHYGYLSHPCVTIEICLPSIYLTTEKANLVNPTAAIGFNVNVQIPLKSKAK